MDKLNPVQEPKDRPRSSGGPHIYLLTSNIFTGKQLEDGLGSLECAYVPFVTNSVSCSSASSLKMDWEIQGIHICPLLTSNVLSLPASSSKMDQAVQSIYICSLLTSKILSLPASRSGMDQGARYVHICPHLTSNVLSFLTSMDRGVWGIHIHPLDS